MKHPDATHLENTLARACPTTQHAAIMMAERDQLGRQRYGQDVDANPLTAAQWAHHAAEEAADGLKYAIRARKEAEKLEVMVQALRTANVALVERVKRLVERVKRLVEAGEELRKSSRTFLLTHVDDDGNEDAISIDQVNPESAVQWEDPPSAGEHARLRNAINGWSKAKGQP